MARSPDYSMLIGRTATPAFAIDARGRVAASNAGAREMLGVEVAAGERPRCRDVVEALEADGTSSCSDSCNWLDGVTAGVCTMDWSWWRRSDGSLLRIAATAVDAPRSRDRAAAALLVFITVLDPNPARANGGSVPPGPSAAGSGPTEPTAAEDSEAALAVPIDALTGRELEVLRLLELGRSNREVAEVLVLSPHTVRTHVQHILAKLGAHSKLAAVSIASRSGLLELPAQE